MMSTKEYGSRTWIKFQGESYGSLEGENQMLSGRYIPQLLESNKL